MQVQSLVKELRSHVLHHMAKVIIIITKRNQIGLKQFLGLVISKVSELSGFPGSKGDILFFFNYSP